MTPARKIAPPDWMTAPAAGAVLGALARAGGAARFVGGCVRDAVIGRNVTDVDIATDLAPESVMTALKQAGLKAVPTGMAHGTVTAVSEHRPYEITTLRRDVETDGRHARVEFTDDWAADAARRDFTMNALYADADGTVYDPTGGLADLAAHRVRFVGAPAQRIEEDALRILRFFRFHAHYGQGEPDMAGLDACAAAAARIAGLSAERVAQEMRKLLKAEAAPQTVWLMSARGILAPVSPALTRFERLDRLVAIERELGEAEPMRRLAALLPTDEAAALALAERLRLSVKERERLAAMTHLPSPPIAARVERYRRGAEGFRDAVLLAGADGADWRAALDAAGSWRPPAFPLRGADLLKLGLAPGPAVGELLQRLEREWIAGGFRPGKAGLLARAREAAAQVK
ncbi:CCA tRNA nucleotidyltransferase [Desertibaculum subflavum]|uniref:CCA tRNA nucleotidyltransferase n=1 Tax=Desertibaculum subflavum TaxID=2268458 RepID=UPI000E66C952